MSAAGGHRPPSVDPFLPRAYATRTSQAPIVNGVPDIDIGPSAAQRGGPDHHLEGPHQPPLTRWTVSPSLRERAFVYVTRPAA